VPARERGLRDDSTQYSAHGAQVISLFFREGLGVVDPQSGAESECPKGMMTWRTKPVLRFLGSDPSPGPLRLEKAPAADHPLPKGEGCLRRWFSALPLGERVAGVASRVRGGRKETLEEFPFAFCPPKE